MKSAFWLRLQYSKAFEINHIFQNNGNGAEWEEPKNLCEIKNNAEIRCDRLPSRSYIDNESLIIFKNKKI